MTIFFLPGAAGLATFSHPVAQHLSLSADHHFFAWPGLGDQPHQDKIQSIDDLVNMVSAKLTKRTTLIGQSMGGYIALRVALERPDLVTHLVLTVTSAGLTMDALGAINWRSQYQKNFPNAASYITEPVQDLAKRFCEIKAPCLLLWGGKDPISPVAVGQKLESLLPNARLIVFEDGDHDLAVHYGKAVAALVDEHLLLPSHPLPKNASGSS